MNQSKLSSLVETIINTAIGFVTSIVLSLIVYPMFGHNFTLTQNAGITAIFTAASIARGYVVRRWFNGQLHQVSFKIADAINAHEERI